MRTIIVLTILTLSLSCNNLKSDEEKVKEIVNEFLTDINDPTKQINEEIMTENYNKMFSVDKSFYTAKDWVLTTTKENDSTYSVESTSNTINSLGKPIENVQKFMLTDEYGKWQIYDSYNLIAFELDFQIVDTQWEFYFDREKDFILNDLKKKVKLEILIPGHGDRWTESRQGKLKLLNDTDFDIKGVDILIEHFDKNNVSVNTDHHGIYDIIRKHGYREFVWYTSDCNKCFSQTFKINFIKEHH